MWPPPASGAPRSLRSRSCGSLGSPPAGRSRSCPAWSRLHPRPAPVLLQQLKSSPPARAPSGPDVAGGDLVLADVDVVVEHDWKELVGRVAFDDPDAAPVVGRADEVHGPSLDLKRLDPGGHHHP